MYHRVATPPSDVWKIAVSPQNFEAQLQVLQRTGRVVPLNTLVQSVKAGKVLNGAIALTFDDGYADNVEVALPLLERYHLPATFFLTSIEQGPFWWDSLELLLLTTPQLPAKLLLPNGGHIDLDKESILTHEMQQRHQMWKPFEMEPPTRRAQLYLDLWQQMRPLIPAEQQNFLHQLHQLNAIVPAAPNNVSSAQQLQSLNKHPLIEIGAHTAQHPALGMHAAGFQQDQISKNKTALERRFDQKINSLAYPYGHYNSDSLQVAASLQFDAAFTTNPERLTKRSHPYQLGRFQVADWNGDLFKQKLSQMWRK